jgi:hypothetical protein
LQHEVAVRDRTINAVHLDGFAVDGERRGESARDIEPFGQKTGVSRRHVVRHEHRCAQVCRQAGDELRQRLNAAG